MRIAREAAYDSLGTFEFLVDARAGRDDAWFAFIEANPRLQVEHTVTEEVSGVDLVQRKSAIAAGARLADLGLDRRRAAPRGYAIQARVNIETMTAAGETVPCGGRISAFDMPSGPGVRVDTFGYAGYRTAVAFDSLIAKVIVACARPRFRRRRRAGSRARSPNSASPASRRTCPSCGAHRAPGLRRQPDRHALRRAPSRRLARRRQGASPPLFRRARGGRGRRPGDALAGPEGTIAVAAPLQGTVVSLDVADGDLVREGQQIAVIEAMKMEHLVTAPCGGIVREIARPQG